MSTNHLRPVLDHYYHFCGELLIGLWAFWSGAFSKPNSFSDPTNLPTVQSPNTILKEQTVYLDPPPINRIIYPYTDQDGWRDGPGFNAYFFRAAFPSVDVETKKDWADRIKVTSGDGACFFSKLRFIPSASAVDLILNVVITTGHKPSDRAWHFDTLLLTDRSAAFRGDFCSQNQRTASEAVERMRRQGRLHKGWWENVRLAVLRFAGADESETGLSPQHAHELSKQGLGQGMILPASSKKVVITYISRQGGRRRLLEPDHKQLVSSLRDMVAKKNAERLQEGTEKGPEWELLVVQAEKLTKDEQVKVAGRSTVGLILPFVVFKLLAES